MKKILHISHSLDTGGGPEYIKKIIINNNGNFDHYVMGNKGIYFIFFKKYLGDNKVFSLKNKNIIYNNLLIKKIIKKIKPDVIHIHGRGAGIYARILNSDYSNKIVYTLHGFNVESLNYLKKNLYLLIEKKLINKTSKIICVSDSERKEFINTLNLEDSRKIITIPNFVEELKSEEYVDNNIIEEKIKNRLDVDIQKYPIKLLTVARLSYQKGIDLSIKALAKLKNKKIILIIIGEGREKKSLMKLVEKEGLKTNVFFLGKIENARTWMKYFDAFLITSRFEGMPYTILEALEAKIPIIATPSRGIKDVLTEKYCYLTKSFDEHEIARTIQKFIDDASLNRNKLNSYINKYYQTINKKYKKDRIISEIYNLYERI